MRPIIQDLLASGYDGGFAIEPHMAVVFHDASVKSDAEAQYANYVEYGRRLGKLIDEIKVELEKSDLAKSAGAGAAR